nr:EAL domain-containing protein [Gellertiella hungarica]
MRRLDLALGASGIGVWEHSISDDTINWDARMHRLYGTTPVSPVPLDIWLNALHPEDVEKAVADFEDAARRKGSYRSEFRIRLADGTVRHIRSMANYYVDANGDPAFIGAEWDVTADVELTRALSQQQRLAEERAAALQESRAQVEYAAEHDYLTGLPNRRSFDRFCRQLSETGTPRRLALMHIDLDRFKQVNDEHGHEAGDTVLRTAAVAIRAALGPEDMAARMGGDEFVIVCLDEHDREELRRRAQGIIDALGTGLELNGKPLLTGASIGIALETGCQVDGLLKDADVALYSAKRRGRGRVVFFHADLLDTDAADLRRAAELREAIASEQILPLYQCQWDGRSGLLAGLEAVPCWNHPEKGLLSISDLLPEVAESGLMALLDRHMLACVFRDLQHWEDEGHAAPRVSLSISAERFSSASLIEEMRRAGSLAGSICFELKASDSLRDMTDATLRATAQLKALGCEIAVSGIRDGEGSLVGLLRLRPNRLKLDRSMVETLTTELDQLRLLHAISDFARAFGMTITADGVSSREQAELLRNLGCATLQGDYEGPPLDRDLIPMRLRPLRRDLKR